jgi:NADH-quinone oxidoreductase subunit L
MRTGAHPELAWLAWTILFAPLVAAAVAGLLVRSRKVLAAGAAIGGIAVGLACTLVLLAKSLPLEGSEGLVVRHQVDWIVAGDFVARFGVVADRLSLLMSLVVTGVGLCIFVYSVGYMAHDESFGRYFACLSLFAFSMLGIVVSTNLLQTFVFWELVGLSSYLLIGFWFAKPSAVEAAKKAFMTNRVGDFGFLCGILLLFYTLAGIPEFGGMAAAGGPEGTRPSAMDFADLARFYREGGAGGAPGFGLLPAGTAALAAILIFCGAVGKSAQFPLHVWLPDAMEGPTPVSALMHAATMVAAGVYMTCRVFFLFEPFPDALLVVAVVGGITAFLAATMAVVQSDIKKVLAYSTLSQLGFMTMALGLGSATAAMFHLTTHAFFKALLFLGSGSVIHACHSQDMFEMGGLRKSMKSTWITWWLGTLALAGVFPLAGFFSKDEILAVAMHGSQGSAAVRGALAALGLVSATLTAFYMMRATLLTFHGEYRGHGHPHESPAVMTVPLWILAVPTVFAGLLGFPPLFHGHPWFQAKFGVAGVTALSTEHAVHGDVVALGTLAAVAGLGFGWLVYGSRKIDAAALKARFAGVHSLLLHRYYIDDFYLWLVRRVQQRFAEACDFIEQNILIRGVVDGIAAGTRAMGDALRELQNGSLHTYLRFAVAGTVLVTTWVLVYAYGGGP